MRLVGRTLGGCVALACAASLSGGTALPALERALTPAPDGNEVTSLSLVDDVPPELQSPATAVRVSVTEVERDVHVEIVDRTGSVVGGAFAAANAVAAGSTGIPTMVLAAYQAAAERIGIDDPSCGLRWQMLAGIGKIESSHARGGQLNAAGVSVPRIIGPVLNGGPGVAAISDSDDGVWDGDSVWDRAVGPMQFIPGTWRGYGADADDDGVADPHNVWDATLAAGRYLCAGDGNLRTLGGLQAALFRYNHSLSYVNHVLSWINAYEDGEPTVTPDRGPGEPTADPDDKSREPEAPKVPEPDDEKDADPNETPGRIDEDPQDPDDPPEDPDDPPEDPDDPPDDPDDPPDDPDDPDDASDLDRDGIPDTVEVGEDPTDPIDTDGDGVPDLEDEDSDGDGIPDSVEAGDDPTDPVDTDSDGTPDYLDLDSDGDGIPDAVDPTPLDPDGDGDGDGIPDSVEVGEDPTGPVDTDGDGTPDMLDEDSDGDGIPDSVEAGDDPTSPTDTDGDGTPDYLDLDSDGDGIPDAVDPAPLDPDGDGDGDGIPDSAEVGEDPTDPVDTDGDGTPDMLDEDSDGDGIPDSVEAGDDPTSPADTDGDGTPDYLDIDPHGGQ